MSEALVERAGETPPNNKEAQYQDLVDRLQALIEAVPETSELEYQDQRAKTPETVLLARLELVREALEGEAEVRADKGEPYAERGARMVEQLFKAKMEIYKLYCDAQQDSEALARFVKEQFPFVQDMERSANDTLYEEYPKAA